MCIKKTKVIIKQIKLNKKIKINRREENENEKFAVKDIGRRN